MGAFSASRWNDIADTMGRLREAGKIRSWGIAGPCRRYDLEHLRSNVPFVVQQPYVELDEVPRPSFVHGRLAFATFAAFLALQAKGGYRDFLERSANKYPDPSF